MFSSLHNTIQTMTKKGPLFLVGVLFATILLVIFLQSLRKGKKGYNLILGTALFVKASAYELTTKVSFPTQDKIQEMVNYFLIGLFVFTILLLVINQSLSKMIDWIYIYLQLKNG